MPNGPSAGPFVSPDPVFDTLFAYQRSAALRTAIDLDLFRHVGEGRSDVAALAAAVAAAEKGIRVLCDFMVILEFLAKDGGGRYALTPVSAAFLDSRSPMCVASAARFLDGPMLHQAYDQLAEAVRKGGTALPGQGSVEPDNPAWVEFAESMAPLMGLLAPPVASLALAGTSGPASVLDLAAGHGRFGIACLEQARDATVTAVDWAAVLEVAKRNARQAGVADRYRTAAGSAFEVDFGGPHDVALLTNFLHHFDVATCTGLLRKVRAALKPGGKAVTLEFVPDEGRVSPPRPAGFALTMLATTAHGDAYTFSELAAMYRDAGYGDVSAHPTPGPHTIVVGVTQ